MSHKCCVVGGCGNITTSEISLHHWPKDPKTRQLWTKFVQNSRADFAKGPTQWSDICSGHFEEDAFDPSFRIKQSLGFTGMKRLVLPGKYPILKVPKSRSGNVKRDESDKGSSEPWPSGNSAIVTTSTSSTARTGTSSASTGPTPLVPVARPSTSCDTSATNDFTEPQRKKDRASPRSPLRKKLLNCVSPKKRLNAKQALLHPWLREDFSDASISQMLHSQEEIKELNARRKLKELHLSGESNWQPSMEEDCGWLLDDSPSPQSETGQAATKSRSHRTQSKYFEYGFKFTCLEKLQSILFINYQDLRKKGLGIAPGELVDGRRLTTKIPSNWTIHQLRGKVLELFPRLRTFKIYKGTVCGGKLVPVASRTVRALRKEINRSCLYIVPDTPLAPLDGEEPDQVDPAEDEVTSIDLVHSSPAPSEHSEASQSESLRSISPSVCEVDDSPVPSETNTGEQPESPEDRDPQTTCVIRNCSDRRWSDDDSLALHKFPVDENAAQKWVNFVRYTQRDYDPSPSDRICSRHFHSNSYEAVPLLNEHMFCTRELYRLRPEAFPTILYAQEPEEVGLPMDSSEGESGAEGRAGLRGCETGGGEKSMASTKYPKNKLHYVKLTEINAYITCFLCGGYMFNATTITECLHSFCRKCILQHFQKDNKCPTCDILIHESIPFHFIRPDGLLQMIINKLLPNFESIEKEAERKLREDQPSRPATPVPLLPTAETVPIYAKTVSSAQISLQLEYMGASSDCPPITPLEKNFVRVSCMATIRHVQKFISHKLQLGEEFEVDIICGEEILQPAVVLYNLKREVEKEQIIDNILVLSYSLGLREGAIIQPGIFVDERCWLD